MARDFSNLEQNRLEKAQRLRDKGIDPYPLRAQRTHTSQEAIQTFEEAQAAGQVSPSR
jgi:lysyl-tRNA synthetase class 2